MSILVNKDSRIVVQGITGSEGQLGQAFVSRLKNLGYHVIGFDKGEQINQEIKPQLKEYI